MSIAIITSTKCLISDGYIVEPGGNKELHIKLSPQLGSKIFYITYCLYIQHRYAQRNGCKNYCSVSCTQPLNLWKMCNDSGCLALRFYLVKFSSHFLYRRRAPNSSNSIIRHHLYLHNVHIKDVSIVQLCEH